MGEAMSVVELKALLQDKALMKELPLTKTMITYIVNLVKEKERILEKVNEG